MALYLQLTTTVATTFTSGPTGAECCSSVPKPPAVSNSSQREGKVYLNVVVVGWGHYINILDTAPLVFPRISQMYLSTFPKRPQEYYMIYQTLHVLL